MKRQPILAQEDRLDTLTVGDDMGSRLCRDLVPELLRPGEQRGAHALENFAFKDKRRAKVVRTAWL